MRWSLQLCLALGLGLGVVTVPCIATAEPPPGINPDSPLHKWFERQHSIRGGWCCVEADGHILADTEWRQQPAAGSQQDSHYEVQIQGSWYPIPQDTIRDTIGGPNPTGKAIVWYTIVNDSPIIYCFAPGVQY
jgi:hypothetical protein